METSIDPLMEDLKKINKVVAPEVSETDIGPAIASLKTHAGWKEIEEYINVTLDRLNEVDTDNQTIEGIGYEYMVVKAVSLHLNTILSIVNENYEYEKEQKEGDSEKDEY